MRSSGWTPGARLRLALLLSVSACTRPAPAPSADSNAPPEPPPAAWAGLIGDYAGGGDTLSVREQAGELQTVFWRDSTNASDLDQTAIETAPNGRGTG